jgi:phosphoserine phosphatase
MNLLKQNKYIALDVDSTLCTIEGIDELARHQGVYGDVAQLTQQAMGGQKPMEEIFAARLALINPQKMTLDWLAQQYRQNLHVQAVDFCNWLIANQWEIFLVTGGYQAALLPLAADLHIAPDHVLANQLHFDNHGNYMGWNDKIPLWTAPGKREVIHRLQDQYPGYWVMMGDAQTDFMTSPIVDRFICFAGIVQRTTIMDKSSIVCHTYQQVITYLQVDQYTIKQ